MPSQRFILLYCADAELLAIMTRNLQMYTCDVTAVHDAKKAIALTENKDHAFACGVLVHTRRADPAGRLIHLLLENGTRMPLLLVDQVGDLAPARYADLVLYGLNTSAAHIAAALRLLTRYRKGPKPRSAA